MFCAGVLGCDVHFIFCPYLVLSVILKARRHHCSDHVSLHPEVRLFSDIFHHLFVNFTCQFLLLQDLSIKQTRPHTLGDCSSFLFSFSSNALRLS
ncbi:hypothetical protein B0F90DRAFT_1738909 [Multifurca ochricompacta]|uniref:Uncharacterized protein n=1 Tax=Multifurca ochricompacta TaxID=376703 RepID=A0AAD4QLY4_9AGAM|nr:hypothetical protein B0F90DRAFT_1738909 [Multifurca ochricompacta]